MKTTLLISTYNRPDALRLVIDSAISQTLLPDEIVICDDGSGDETKVVINEMRAKSPVPIRHVWHEDRGFRLSMIRNKGVAASNGDYILQIDGDCILSKNYVKDHVELAEYGYFAGGRRVMLNRVMTEATLRKGHLSISFFGLLFQKKGIRYLKNMIRLSLLRKSYTNYITRKRIKSKKASVDGASFSFWRSDFIAVNGYDENMVGWGWEDSDIVLRMQNIGLKGTAIRFGGYSFHLDHPVRGTQKDRIHNPNYQLLLQHINQGATRIENGIDKWLSR